MSTKEIPRPEWTTFLDSFSRQHEGWPRCPAEMADGVVLEKSG